MRTRRDTCVCVCVSQLIYVLNQRLPMKAGVIHSVSCISAGFCRRSATCSRINAEALQMTCMGGLPGTSAGTLHHGCLDWEEAQVCKGFTGLWECKALRFALRKRKQNSDASTQSITRSLPKWGGRSCRRLLYIIVQIDQRKWTAWSIINRLGASLIDCEHVFLWEWRLISI